MNGHQGHREAERAEARMLLEQVAMEAMLPTWARQMPLLFSGQEAVKGHVQ